MEFIQLRSSLQKVYHRDTWYEIFKFIFADQISFEAKPENIAVEKGKAKSIKRFASIILDKDIRVAVIEIETKKEIQIARNRVALRDIVFRLIDQDRYSGLLVLYYSEDSVQTDYRLSLICSQTEFDSAGNLIKVQTHPKRFSYVLGQNESCTTAAQRFLSLRIKTPKYQAFADGDKGISLKNLLEAFSVEALNKEFFKKYKEIYYKNFWEYLANRPEYSKLLLDQEQVEISRQQKPIRDFVKKLLGRIVFLHFLQKKGWMGCSPDTVTWDNGDRQFMRNLFLAYNRKSHFYSECLIELFHNTLNNANRKKGLFKYTETRVPYLNGGLFDDDQPQTNCIDFPMSYFSDLFEFFSQYNFTIDENSPDEQEVGIDPEMLGHIFENLLEDNKDKGTFYTPRQIVHYMCQDSLIQYLQTYFSTGDNDAIEDFIRTGNIGDKKDRKNFIVNNAKRIEQLLDSVKICDPAIGSGAFPMGMLQEIFKAKLSLDLTLDRAQVKKDIIQNSIYGIDLEKGAVDIARLRFWLTLVVDEDEPQPLPNLDYKIMQGNSLLESFEGVDLSKVHAISKVVQVYEPGRDLFGEIINPQLNLTDNTILKENDLQNQMGIFFNETNPVKKITQRKKISETVHNHIDYNLELWLNSLARQIDQAPDIDQPRIKLATRKKIQALKDEKERLEATRRRLHQLQNTEEKPYFLWHLFFKDVFDEGGFDIVIGNPPYVQLQKMGAETDYLEKIGFETFSRTGDVYCLFYEIGFKMLKPHGILSFITSNKWMRAAYGEALRRYFVNNTNPLRLIDFGGFQVFESATVDTNIFVGQKTSFQNTVNTCVLGKDFSLNNMSDYFRQNSSISNSLSTSGSWVVLSSVEQRIKNKIEQIGKPLKDWEVQINYGIKTGFNEAFIIDAETRNILIEKSPKNDEIIRPILLGKNIKRYKYNDEGHWILNIHNGIKSRDIQRIKVEDDYPAVFEYLKQFLPKISERSDQGDHWTNLRNCAYLEEFNKPKIVWGNLSLTNQFAYISEPMIINNPSNFLVTDNLYLLGILNSRLSDFYIKQLGISRSGGYFEYKPMFVEQMPVALPDKEVELRIQQIVATILQSKGPFHNLEEMIDDIVFDLYGLTNAEKEFIYNTAVSRY